MDAPEVEQPSGTPPPRFFDANGLRDPVGTVRDHEDDAVGVSSLPLEPDNACAVIVDHAESGGWVPLIDQLSALWIERQGASMVTLPAASNAGSPSILMTGGRLPSTETITALAETGGRVPIKRKRSGLAVEVLRHSSSGASRRRP